jgi:hypothetical protein
MAQFRKKPVVVEAFRWTGGPDQAEDPIWAIEAIKQKRVRFIDPGPFVRLEILSLEGVMTAAVGDWIIKGVKGELYCCKPDIFAETHDAVEAAA